MESLTELACPILLGDIEMIVRKNLQLRWAGHVARMSDDRNPKQSITVGSRPGPPTSELEGLRRLTKTH